MNTICRFLVLGATALLVGTACRSVAPRQDSPEPSAVRVVKSSGVAMVRELDDLSGGQQIPGGLAYNRHTYEGYYVTGDPDNELNGLKFTGVTWILYKPRTPGESMNAENIIYQNMLEQDWDEDGDQIWLMGEFSPPKGDKQPRQWTVAATGKYAGVKGTGLWHWNWPDNLEEPTVPDGYDYANAQELNLEFGGEAANAATGAVAAYQLAGAEPYSLGGRTGNLDSVAWLKELDDFGESRYGLPGGLAFNRHTYESVVETHETDNPHNGIRTVGVTMILFKPSEPGEAFSPENIIYQNLLEENIDKDGDHYWLAGEYSPLTGDKQPFQWVTVGTGKFEGMKGKGLWHWNWPTHLPEPQPREGFDYPNTQELIMWFPPDKALH